MNRLSFIALGLCSSFISGYSQDVSVTGESPNYYLKVDEVLTNGVRITETISGQLTHFTSGDKVLVIQMTGETIDSAGDFKTTETRSRKETNNTGKFEVLQIDEVVTGADTIIYFTDDFSNLYDGSEKIQVVRLIEGSTVSVNGTLTVKPWNGTVGGIIAIIGIDTVKLGDNTTIDASAKGFRGGGQYLQKFTPMGCAGSISVLSSRILCISDLLKRAGQELKAKELYQQAGLIHVEEALTSMVVVPVADFTQAEAAGATIL